MKNRVGIITQPLGGNYGGVLQNYALQKVIHSMGYEPVTLFLNVSYPYYRYCVSCLISVVLKLIGIKRPIPPKPYRGRSLYKTTANFILKNINLIPPGYSSYNMALLTDNKIDALVVGSDQVWRPLYNNHIEDMFLEFAKDFNGAKVAYAASFGVDEWTYSDEQTRNCRNLIQQFSAVSVREVSGIKLCRLNLSRENVCHVLDPTLLLHGEDYLSLCINVKKHKKDCLFAYILDSDERINSILQNISVTKQFQVIKTSHYIEDGLSVEEWLTSINEAALVVTDSFHATVFSILFKKNFIVVNNDIRGNTRIISLLDSIGLKDRIISSRTNIDVVDRSINWDFVETELNKQRNFSYSFLQKNISQINQ